MKKSPKFFISILCLNCLTETQRCLNAVLAAEGCFMILVQDNGSEIETRDYLDSLSDYRVRILHHAENRGFQLPNNEAFLHAAELGCDYFIALNNDTSPPPTWLLDLEQAFIENPKAALVGSLDGNHTLKDNFQGHVGSVYEYVEGACLCAKIEVLMNSGGCLFSPYLEFAYGEDSDLSLRMRERGYEIRGVNIALGHIHSVTRNTQPGLRERCEQAEARNHEILRRRWGHYLRVRTFDYPIVLKRTHALGDVLLLDSLCRTLRRERPLSQVHVECNTPQLFANNPRVSVEPCHNPDALIVDLNMAYENRPGMSIVKAYHEAAGVETDRYEPPQFFPSEQDQQAFSLIPSGKWCAIHSEPTTWPAKNWHPDRWKALANWMLERAWNIVLVGKGPPENAHTLNLLNQTSFLQLAAVLARCRMFIGHDSFPLHCAVASRTEIIIGLFGITSPEIILPTITHSLGSDPAHPWTGARHRTIGMTDVRTSSNPMDTITVDAVKRAVLSHE